MRQLSPDVPPSLSSATDQLLVAALTLVAVLTFLAIVLIALLTVILVAALTLIAILTDLTVILIVALALFTTLSGIAGIVQVTRIRSNRDRTLGVDGPRDDQCPSADTQPYDQNEHNPASE